ncbi:MAG: TolC family protein [Acidobacteria bacterium]|nr:TolC family protein [Acidobacteriota bacterium]
MRAILQVAYIEGETAANLRMTVLKSAIAITTLIFGAVVTLSQTKPAVPVATPVIQPSPQTVSPTPVSSPAAGIQPTATPEPQRPTVTVPDSVRANDATTATSLNAAIDKAIQQASAFKTSSLNESIATEDVNQARAAFLPKVTAPLDFIYTSPSLGATRPRPPSFIAANAVTEFQALLTAAGEIDTSGKLKATLRKDLALVESARAGTQVARLDLIQAVTDAYYTLALSAAKRRGAETNLQTALDFEHNVQINLDAGEVAPIDLVRARLQTSAREDELAQALTEEAVNGGALRILVGLDLAAPINVDDLLIQLPVDNEIERYTDTAIATRPELQQIEADRRAAEADIALARSERKPQLTYSLSTGFDSDSLFPRPLRDHSGIQATVGFTIPIFDWGVSRSKERQARFKVQQQDNARAIALRQFAQAFYAARTQALFARDRVRRLAASIRDAETNVTTSTARYRAGEAPISEVVDAENLLVTTRQAYYQALYDYQTAKARLARASGQ